MTDLQICQRKQRRLLFLIAAFCVAAWAGLVAVDPVGRIVALQLEAGE